MIDILYREDVADLLKMGVREQFGDDFEAVVRNIVSCYKRHNIVVMVYPCRARRHHKKGGGALLRLIPPKICIELHNRYQMLLTLFHELEHLGRPLMSCLSKKQTQMEEQLVERRTKSIYYQYERLSRLRQEMPNETH